MFLCYIIYKYIIIYKGWKRLRFSSEGKEISYDGKQL
jgi:hypothetical protein